MHSGPRMAKEARLPKCRPMRPALPINAAALQPSSLLLGVACGIGAAFCWAAGFVTARHGILHGLAPADIALHRFVWAGLALLPGALANRFAEVTAIGWARALALTIVAGPLQALGLRSPDQRGVKENLVQVLAQGLLAGIAAIYLFARAVTLLGASRASTFPALVPAFGIVIGYLALGEVPTVYQLVGLAVVAVGFRLALKQ
jgi:drug/metabolite transporter (DMT)-like permease